MGSVINVLVVGFLILLVLHFLRSRPSSTFQIVIRETRVEIHGPVARGKRSQIEEFFREELPDVRQAQVHGSWEGQRLRLHFGGRLSPAYQQRIRNFLSLTL